MRNIGAILAAAGPLIEREPMRRHTTLLVGGVARWLVQPTSEERLSEMLATLPATLPILPLGRGSNMLLDDSGFDGVVIDLSGLDFLQQQGERIRAGAGTRMGKIAQHCGNAGLTGVEFMATVPGDLGGGVVMNAGAHGQELSDTLRSIVIVHRDGRREEIESSRLEMSYRHTQLPLGAIVVAAELELARGNSGEIREAMRAMRARRGATQPLTLPNCGSVFKNPPGDHAGRLIEAVGLKGHAIGGARISEMHANFIVNGGNASSRDIWALIELAQAKVEAEFGIRLEPEVKRIANPGAPVVGKETEA